LAAEQEEQAVFRDELIDAISTEVRCSTGALQDAVDIIDIAANSADEIMRRFELRRRA
jgi:hypothetical protein